MRIALALLISLAALCSGAAAPSCAVAQDLDELLVSPLVVELAPGEETDLTVTGLFDDGSTADLTNQVTFTSDDEDVAIVIGSTVVAVGDGEAEIDVEHGPSGVRADAPVEVTVWEILALTIAPTAVTVQEGETTRLTALAELSDGRTGFDVTGVVDWESDETSVATVVDGLVTALSPGEADISVTDPSSGTSSENDASVVTVEPIPDPDAKLLEVIATPEDILAIVGDVAQLTVMGVFDDDTIRDITDEVTYETSSLSVATVDTQGRIFALAPGLATIRVDHPAGRSASERPEIWVGELQELHLDPVQAVATVGQSFPFLALATYDNGLGADVTEQVSWSSDDTSVAVVSSFAGTRGLTSAVSAGTARISALHLGTGIRTPETEGEVTVVAPTPTPGPSATPTPTPSPTPMLRDLVVDPAVLRLGVGETKTISVTAINLDGSQTDVTDEVSIKIRDRRVATVSGADVTALSEGHTEIQVRDLVTGRRARMPGRIEVTRLLALRIVPSHVAVGIGEDVALQAFADFDDGSTDVDVTGLVSWEFIGPEGVASVDDGAEKGKLTGLADGRGQVRVTDPNSGLWSDGATGHVSVGAPLEEDSLQLVGFVFDPAHLIVPHREERVISVSGVLADDSIVPLDPVDLTFRTLHRRIVRVGSDGRVRARRPGIAVVTVTHDASGVRGWFPVTVRAINRLRIDPPDTVVEVGDVIDLAALGTFNDGSPEEDHTGDVRWRSLDPGLVRMDRSVPGRALARREGVAIVEASHRVSRTRSDAKTGVVRVVTGLVRISVSPGFAAVAEAGNVALQALAHFSDGSIVDVTTEVDWTTTDPLVATVDAAGLLTAHAVGDVRVVAADPESGRVSEGLDRAVVAVGRTLIGLQVSRSEDLEEAGVAPFFLAAGQTGQLYGLAVLDDAGPANWTDQLEWTSSSPATVGVTQDGLVTCNAAGSAVISVVHLATPLSSTDTLGDRIVTCSPATLDRIEVRPAESNVDFPGGRNLRLFRVFTDGHEVEITSSARWRSEDPASLSVVETGENAGRVTGLEDAIVTVTAIDDGFGQEATGQVTVRKVRVDLRIFENVPEPDNDGVFRGQVDDLIKLKARVEFASGATQGVNQVVNWTSSNTDVVQMGEDAGLQKNWGRMVGPGTATITATWPADEFSPELTDSVEFEVSN